MLQPWHSPPFTKGLDRHRAHRFGTPQHGPATWRRREGSVSVRDAKGDVKQIPRIDKTKDDKLDALYDHFVMSDQG